MVPMLNHSLFIKINNKIMRVITEIVIEKGLEIKINFSFLGSLLFHNSTLGCKESNGFLTDLCSVEKKKISLIIFK